MNTYEKQMLAILEKGRKDLGFVAVKAEFEAEGTRSDEFLRLLELARRAGLKVALKIKANKVAALPQLQSQLDELTTRYELLLQQLPAQKELATMLASVNELGIDNKLTFTRIDWGEKQSEHFLYRLPLNIELTGDFHDIGHFSQAIATLPRIITFKDVTWQRVSQESETLHFRVRANTYQFKPEETNNDK